MSSAHLGGPRSSYPFPCLRAQPLYKDSGSFASLSLIFQFPLGKSKATEEAGHGVTYLCKHQSIIQDPTQPHISRSLLTYSISRPNIPPARGGKDAVPQTQVPTWRIRLQDHPHRIRRQDPSPTGATARLLPSSTFMIGQAMSLDYFGSPFSHPDHPSEQWVRHDKAIVDNVSLPSIICQRSFTSSSSGQRMQSSGCPLPRCESPTTTPVPLLAANTAATGEARLQGQGIPSVRVF